MPDLTYVDFDLEIERTPNGYRVEVTRSPVGNARAEFVLPFSDLEIENVLLKLGGARRRVRRVESPETDAAKQFGGKLFNAVFTGDVRSVYAASVQETNTRDVGLRVRLHLDDAPELADLPWEFLYNPSLNRFLALSVKTPIVRFLELPEQIRPLTVHPPLRVLVMISSPTDYEALDVEREWQQLQNALTDSIERGTVTLERLESATLSELQNKLQAREVHIFHFIGHGAFDEGAQDGVLIFEGNEKRGRRVSAQTLGTILHDHDSLRLAVLNACEGARTSRSDPFAGVAQSLVQQGVPAVIAMQFEISDAAATTFARAFYQALANGYPVDAATTEVRKTIFADNNEMEWGTPVLYLRAPDGKIFDVQGAPNVVVPPPVATNKPTTSPAPALPQKYILPIVGAGILALLLLFGGIYAVGNLSRTATPTTTFPPPTFPGPIPNPGQMPTDINIPSGTFLPPTVPDKGTLPTALATARTSSGYIIEQRGKDNAPMVLVPAGKYTIGSDLGSEDERPAHQVFLDAFWIDQHEVTNAQYRNCSAAGKCQPPSQNGSYSRESYYGNAEFDNYPVIFVSWHDASAYCTWAGKRLPTEAEWESAARGVDARRYPWGNEFDQRRLNSNEVTKDTSDVNTYPSGRSEFGAFDMAGNVWEWVADWYEAAYYATLPSETENPKGPTLGQARGLRGGAWDSDEFFVRLSHRGDTLPDTRNHNIGFRCAQSP